MVGSCLEQHAREGLAAVATITIIMRTDIDGRDVCICFSKLTQHLFMNLVQNCDAARSYASLIGNDNDWKAGVVQTFHAFSYTGK